MKVNWLRVLGNVVWLVFLVGGTISAVFWLSQIPKELCASCYAFDYNFNREVYTGVLGFFIFLTVVAGGIPLSVTLAHIFSKDWSFWEWLARTFPAPEPKLEIETTPEPSDWRE